MFGFNQPKLPQITAEEVKQAIDVKESMTILDVRTPGELVRGKIQGSINVPVDIIAREVEKTIPNKQQKIYVYCLSGNRSARAVSSMVKLGYTNVFDMQSGLLAWRVKGYPLE